ncbi:DHH family phosphoesterase [Alicyclobacillus mengziensis]|uniref:Bifunctional oligoribonuclease/PAP phosphatase NrnA n=1 Tax=Alicyclobacillus mengziensis TaxID=2931921 RepID=A0A9X7VUU6_9BACL|nr:bifunctional oligoribonuclease/PAP phosphatase NrnA [Alicyclobacillus mengziensis]QSO45382.1 bifunctional oligoribonuclease/PAP phosphatase NrnA [Alicyclobacillus mengziensis]
MSEPRKEVLQHSGDAGWVPTPRRPAELRRVAEELGKHDDWLIVTHERPDGDAVGSALAMACILTAIGKRWTFGVGETLPVRFSFLPHFGQAIILDDSHAAKFHAVVAVDCADARRFRYAASAIAKDACVVNIDHHPTNPAYGTVNMVDSEAAATCELGYQIARELSLPMDEDLAKCLYTGILTDTGGFAQPNTTRAVHQIAAELLASGVQPYDIAGPALEARTWKQTELLKKSLTTLTLFEGGLGASLYVTREMLDSTGCSDDDTEILVGFARAIDSVEVGMMFKELADGRVKVSLRSKRCVDVARVAQSFSGGGHVRAAGCELTEDLETAMQLVQGKVQEALMEAADCIAGYSSSISQRD